jgi:hypothetical protein
MCALVWPTKTQTVLNTQGAISACGLGLRISKSPFGHTSVQYQVAFELLSGALTRSGNVPKALS